MPNCTDGCDQEGRKVLNPPPVHVRYDDHGYSTKKSPEPEKESTPIAPPPTENDFTELESELTLANCTDCSDKQKEIDDLKRTIKTYENDLKEAHAKMDRALKSFNEDQVKKLEYPDGNWRWSSETIQKAIQLYYSCGTTGYNLMLRQGQPLPSIRTLQRHLAKVDCSPGILYNFIELLKKKVALLDPKDKFYNLSCDEMVVQAMEQYDAGEQCFVGYPTLRASDTLIEKRKKEGLQDGEGLATHAFNIMVCGVRFRYKQVIAYHFTDASFNAIECAKLLKTLIRELKKIGLTCVSLTLDNGPGNQAL